MWAIGGWLNYGERRYGEMYKDVAETTGCSEEMVRLDQRGSQRAGALAACGNYRGITHSGYRGITHFHSWYHPLAATEAAS